MSHGSHSCGSNEYLLNPLRRNKKRRKMIHLRCTHRPEDKEEEVADDKEKKELYKKKKKQIDL